MLRILSRVFVAVLSLVLVSAISLLLIFKIMIDREDIAQFVSRYVSSATGRIVHVEDVRFRFGINPEIHAFGVEIDSSIRIRSFDVRIATSSLLLGRFKVDEIRVEGLRARIVRKKDGRFTLDIGQDPIRDEWELSVVQCARLVMWDTDLEFEDQLTPTIEPVVFTIDRFDTEELFCGSGAKFNGNGRSNKGGHFDFKGEVEGGGKILPIGVNPIRLELVAESVSGALVGPYLLTTRGIRRFDGFIDFALKFDDVYNSAKGARLSLDLVSGEVEIGNVLLRSPSRLTGRLEFDEIIHLRDGHLETESAQYLGYQIGSLRSNFEYSENRIVFKKLQFEGSTLDLMPGFIVPNNIEFRLESVGHVDFSGRRGSVFIQGASLIVMSKLSETDRPLAISIEHIVVDDLPGTNRLVFNSQLKFRENGTLHMRAEFHQSLSQLVLDRFRAEGSNLFSQELLPYFQTLGSFRGEGYFDVGLNLNRRSGGELIGPVKISWSEGSIEGYGIRCEGESHFSSEFLLGPNSVRVLKAELRAERFYAEGRYARDLRARFQIINQRLTISGFDAFILKEKRHYSMKTPSEEGHRIRLQVPESGEFTWNLPESSISIRDATFVLGTRHGEKSSAVQFYLDELDLSFFDQGAKGKFDMTLESGHLDIQTIRIVDGFRWIGSFETNTEGRLSFKGTLDAKKALWKGKTLQKLHANVRREKDEWSFEGLEFQANGGHWVVNGILEEGYREKVDIRFEITDVEVNDSANDKSIGSCTEATVLSGQGWLRGYLTDAIDNFEFLSGAGKFQARNGCLPNRKLARAIGSALIRVVPGYKGSLLERRNEHRTRLEQAEFDLSIRDGRILVTDGHLLTHDYDFLGNGWVDSNSEFEIKGQMQFTATGIQKALRFISAPERVKEALRLPSIPIVFRGVLSDLDDLNISADGKAIPLATAKGLLGIPVRAGGVAIGAANVVKDLGEAVLETVTSGRKKDNENQERERELSN